MLHFASACRDFLSLAAFCFCCMISESLCFLWEADKLSSFLFPLWISWVFFRFFWRASSRWFPPRRYRTVYIGPTTFHMHFVCVGVDYKGGNVWLCLLAVAVSSVMVSLPGAPWEARQPITSHAYIPTGHAQRITKIHLNIPCKMCHFSRWTMQFPPKDWRQTIPSMTWAKQWQLLFQRGAILQEPWTWFQHPTERTN